MLLQVVGPAYGTAWVDGRAYGGYYFKVLGARDEEEDRDLVFFTRIGAEAWAARG